MGSSAGVHRALSVTTSHGRNRSSPRDERGTANTPPPVARTHTLPRPGTAHPGLPAAHPHSSQHAGTGARGSTPRRGGASRPQAPPLGARAPGRPPPRGGPPGLLRPHLSPVTCGRRPSRSRREEPRGSRARKRRRGRPERAVGGAGRYALHRHEVRGWDGED